MKRDFGTGSITITRVNEYHIAVRGHVRYVATFPPNASESQCDCVLRAMAHALQLGLDQQP